MRALHIVTLVTPTGAFGGPLTVACNQATALSARGCETVVVAGRLGYDRSTEPSLPAQQSRTFPARRLFGHGFSWTISPGMLRELHSLVSGFDVVHIHLGRDLITLPAALIAIRTGKRVVIQTHGMIGPSTHPLARIVDPAVRRVLRSAHAVLTLTQREQRNLESLTGRNVNLRMIANGVPEAVVLPIPEHKEVLFVGRLHPRKRPLMFVEMAKHLLRNGHVATFVLVGPDEGEGAKVQDAIHESGYTNSISWQPGLRPEEIQPRLAKSAVVVLPSVDEVMPMAVLEAMSVGRPVVITHSNGLAKTVRETDSGVVVDTSLEGLVRGVESLLNSASLMRRLGANASAVAQHRFSMDAVARDLIEVYQGP